MEHTPAKVSIAQNIRPSVNELQISLVFYLELRCLNIYINNYILTVTKDLALYTGVTEYNVSLFITPECNLGLCANNFYYAAHLHTIPQNLK